MGLAAWENLGIALYQVRRVEDAIAAHERAGEIYRAVGDRDRDGSHWPFESWGRLLPEHTTAVSLLDRWPLAATAPALDRGHRTEPAGFSPHDPFSP